MTVDLERRVLALSLAFPLGPRISYPLLHSGTEMKTVKTFYFLEWVTDRHGTSPSVHLSYLHCRAHGLTIFLHPWHCNSLYCKFSELLDNHTV